MNMKKAILSVGMWKRPILHEDGTLTYKTHRRGDTVELDEKEYNRMFSAGVVDPFSEGVDESEPIVAVESDDVVEDEPESQPKVKMKQPLKAAPIAEWKEYASVLGLDLTGLKKREIIAACLAVIE